jgi:2,4-dienoyl-CoA reductase (NADPH2)
MEYPHLFAPGRIGSLTIPNRLVQVPMGLRMAQDGKVSRRDVEFHRERAAGGVGLVIIGGTVADFTSVYRGRVAVEAFDPRTIEGMAARADAIKQHGARAFTQLNHLGRDMHGQADYATVSASAYASPRDLVVPREMSEHDIHRMTGAYGRSARHTQLAGYDGVEVQCAHGYLVAQFLSAGSNRRSDRYGGGLDARMRFLREILEQVKAQCGDDYPTGVRLSAEEGDEGGLTLDDTLAIVEGLQRFGTVDYISITLGMRNDYVKDSAFPDGYALGHGAAVRRASDVPVIVAGRIRTPALAEEALARGDADFVGLGRALIADPEWPAKARGGRSDEIRPCVGFVQDCRLSPGGVTCAVNARAGREVDWGAQPPAAAAPQRVVVVGGGPAGLEAARLTAGMGHSVVLFERDDAVGGQIRLAARGPTRGDLLELITYQEREVSRLGVELRLGTAATREDILALRPDAVILATGSTPRPPAFPVEGRANVMTVWDLLGGCEAPAGERAVVVDDGAGFWQSVSAAEYLAGRVAGVELVTPARAIGLAIPHESIGGVHARLRGAGVRFRTFSTVESVHGSTVTLRDTITGERSTLTAGTVAVVTHLSANDELLRALTGEVAALTAVGDCSSPRRLTHAILDASIAARSLALGALGPTAPPLYDAPAV